MTNKEIFNLYEGLYELSQDRDLKFGVKISYIFAKNKNILEPFYNAIIDTRQKLLNKYGEAQENGDWHVSKEKMDIFMSEWDSFMKIDNFVAIDKINIEELSEEKIGIDLMEKLLPIIK